MVCSPRAEDDGTGRILRVNVGGLRSVTRGSGGSGTAQGGGAAGRAAGGGGRLCRGSRLQFIKGRWRPQGTPAQDGGGGQAGCQCPGHGRWPDGPRRAGGLGRCGRSGLGRASGSAQSGSVDFLFFFEIFFSAKTNPGNAQKMFRGTKNTQKITKIPEKFLEID
jgi:hypothetical protein